jgi:GTP-binding protein
VVSQTFIDEARIRVSSGSGGNGHVGFRREKFEPRGGPDGGDGGRGGDVVLLATRNETTLLAFRSRREFRAQSGEPGGRAGRTGADAEHLEIRVPLGTLVLDDGAGEDAPPLVDLSQEGQRFVAARGGRGGKGNAHFKTSRRQTPNFAQPGALGEERALHLSLKLIADVGLIGFPNAGKSTLIRSLSAARPRVAAYPFTTLVPTLGVVEQGDRRFVMADIPGLIEGASEGTGLGDQFLRHVERTRVLVHVLDLGAMLFEGRDPRADYETLRKELGHYRPDLLERREIVLLNKIDLFTGGEHRQQVEDLETSFADRGSQLLCGSGSTGEGTRELVAALLRALDDADRATESESGSARS